jgi:hypothetical protein
MDDFFVLSDIHLEFCTNFKTILKRIPDSISGKTLLLAGDVGYPLNSKGYPNGMLLTFLQQCKAKVGMTGHVLYTPGNHEYYQCHHFSISVDQVDKVLQSICEEANITFMNRGTTMIGDVQVIACTLWSLPSTVAYKGMNDGIKMCLTRQEFIDMHLRDVRWLRTELSLSTAPRTIVMSHHLPTLEFICQEHRNNRYVTGYASNVLERLDVLPDAWVCGHYHTVSKMIYRNTTRLYRNPVGYPGELKPSKCWNGWLEQDYNWCSHDHCLTSTVWFGSNQQLSEHFTTSHANVRKTSTPSPISTY